MLLSRYEDLDSETGATGGLMEKRASGRWVRVEEIREALELAGDLDSFDARDLAHAEIVEQLGGDPA